MILLTSLLISGSFVNETVIPANVTPEDFDARDLVNELGDELDLNDTELDDLRRLIGEELYHEGVTLDDYLDFVENLNDSPIGGGQLGGFIEDLSGADETYIAEVEHQYFINTTSSSIAHNVLYSQGTLTPCNILSKKFYYNSDVINRYELTGLSDYSAYAEQDYCLNGQTFHLVIILTNDSFSMPLCSTGNNELIQGLIYRHCAIDGVSEAVLYNETHHFGLRMVGFFIGNESPYAEFTKTFLKQFI